MSYKLELTIYAHGAMYRFIGLKGESVLLEAHEQTGKPFIREMFSRATAISKYHNLKGVIKYNLHVEIKYRGITVANTMPYVTPRLLPNNLDKALRKVDVGLDGVSLKDIKSFKAYTCIHSNVCSISGSLCDDPHCSLNQNYTEEYDA